MRPYRVIFLLLASAFSVTCSLPNSGEAAQDSISRDAFIQAYVELRVAALGADDQELTAQLRDQVLLPLELEERDILNFVEVHGEDVQFMRRVWEEVDSIMTERRTPSEPAVPRGSA